MIVPRTYLKFFGFNFATMAALLVVVTLIESKFQLASSQEIPTDDIKFTDFKGDTSTPSAKGKLFCDKREAQITSPQTTGKSNQFVRLADGGHYFQKFRRNLKYTGSQERRCPGAASEPGRGLALPIEPPPGAGARTVVTPQLGRHWPVVHHNRLNDPQCCLVIAHAGGRAGSIAYSNSREALERGYGLGRRIFEIDFSETYDGYLVLLHDWKRTGSDRLSRAKFLETKGKHGLSRLDLDGLARWLLKNPGSVIVTDFKGDFDRFFRILEARLPAWFMEKYFVIQVYDLATLHQLRKTKPNLRLILTIYRMKVSDDTLVQALAKGGVIALTIPLSRALRSLPLLRKQLPNLPLYVHGSPTGINAPELHARLQALGASGFYLE